MRWAVAAGQDLIMVDDHKAAKEQRDLAKTDEEEEAAAKYQRLDR